MGLQKSSILLEYVCCETFQQKGGEPVKNILLNLILAVMANIVSHYICKWLDRKWSQPAQTDKAWATLKGLGGQEFSLAFFVFPYGILNFVFRIFKLILENYRLG